MYCFVYHVFRDDRYNWVYLSINCTKYMNEHRKKMWVSVFDFEIQFFFINFLFFSFSENNSHKSIFEHFRTLTRPIISQDIFPNSPPHTLFQFLFFCSFFIFLI
jgi:hypothetical protein